MKCALGCLLIFVLGVAVGGGAMWADYNLRQKTIIASSNTLDHLMALASMRIREDNMHCKGLADEKVGTALASILNASATSKLNRLNYTCDKETSGICTISYSNCLPWQTDGCGGRILKFQTGATGVVTRDGFECIDTP